MLLIANLDSGSLQEQVGINSPISELKIPRAAAVPIWVQFSKGGKIVDPEILEASIATSTVAANPVFTAPNHGFSAADSVVIKGHGGLPIPITNSAVSASACAITSAAHGMTASDYGVGLDGANLSVGTYLVKIEGHSTSPLVKGTITNVSATTPAVITCAAAHGLEDGDLVTINGTGVAAIDVTAAIVVLSATTFRVAGAGSAATIGNFKRKASDINGTHIATRTAATTFTIPVANYSVNTGGTVTVTTTTPVADGTRTIASVTADTFTITGLNITAAGKGGTATRTTAASLRWTVKTDGLFDQDPALVTLTSFTKSGKGATTIYKGDANYLTTALNTLLGVDPPTTSNDVVQATCMAELSWTGFATGKCNWVRHFVRNDLYKTGEGAPTTTGGATGKTAITNGVSEMSVTFSTALASANWHFLGLPTIRNTTDGSPLGLAVFCLTARSTTGFTVALSGTTDSGNYYLEWTVAID